MKLGLRIIALLVLVSCSKESDAIVDLPLEAQRLLGTWQMTGQKISIGGPLPEEFAEVENGVLFKFEIDGTYAFESVVQSSTIHSGAFEVLQEELILLPSEGDVDEFRYSVDFNGDVMVLSPIAPYICIEGCLYRYERLD